MSHIGWPQGIILGFMAFGLLVHALIDGEPKKGTHRFSIKLIDTAIIFGLLYWGGFFS